MFEFADWNQVETISSAEDDAVSSSSSSVNRVTSIAENLTNQNEINEEHEQEGNLLQTSPKRRHSRTTSLNTKVKLDHLNLSVQFNFRFVFRSNQQQT